MNKNELFNDIKDLEWKWIELLCKTMKWDNVDEMLKKHLRTDEELQEAYDNEGEEYLICYKETLELFIEDFTEDGELWREQINGYLNETGMKPEDIGKVPLA